MKTVLFLFLFIGQLFSQNTSLDQQLYSQYEQFKEPTITHRRFKHGDIWPLIKQLKLDPRFKVKVMGQSIEGRDISLVSFGSGKTQVLLWSQMHGDEPTATMALMDIFNFLKKKNRFENFKSLLESELTLHFIPMLNPDGAEKYQRRNALGVDLNRDALRLQNPESKILKKTRDSLNADWGFNLHDQSRYYGAGRNPETASISFLAPAFNYEKDVNKVRENAMQLICVMNDILQKHIPNKIARYSDEFEPRAFGDNITKWGTSTILIESGGLENDREKQYLRKLHFVILLSAFQSIADGSHEMKSQKEYNNIPYNKYNLFSDLILRKANIEKNGKPYVIDIAFKSNEIEYGISGQFYLKGNITDIGDLSTSFAYEEFDASEYKVEQGKLFPKKIEGFDILQKMNPIDLLAQGYTHFQMINPPSNWKTDNIPFSFLDYHVFVSNEINLGANPSLILKKNGKVEMVVANGVLFDLEKDREEIENVFFEIKN